MMIGANLSVLDFSAYVGLFAVGAVTLNMMLGVLMALRYSPVRSWPHRRFNYFRLHNWSGYLALALCIVHPVILLFNKSVRFRLLDLVWPIHSPRQPVVNTLGGFALYMVAIVVITSFFRVRLGRRLWKSTHFTIYLAAFALFWHSLFTDPSVTNSAIDWFDGGKIFIEMCLSLIVVSVVVRWRYFVEKSRQTSGGS
jgi:methionine sulfoxide reductase heme-binding subunit